MANRSIFSGRSTEKYDNGFSNIKLIRVEYEVIIFCSICWMFVDHFDS